MPVIRQQGAGYDGDRSARAGTSRSPQPQASCRVPGAEGAPAWYPREIRTYARYVNALRQCASPVRLWQRTLKSSVYEHKRRSDLIDE